MCYKNSMGHSDEHTLASQSFREAPVTTGILEDSVKLVIWDLDETLWTGTLSEGPVEISPRRSNIVRELNKRGIMNSICSKNDMEKVRLRLIAEDNLWDEFIFPRVAWLPKGREVAMIVDDIQLRPPQVLFIDDNPGNRQEVAFYVPGIQTSGPGIIDDLLDKPQLTGRADPDLTRLARYRLLELRTRHREQSSDSNEDFLRSADIRVSIGANCTDEGPFERIIDLVQRTNQLNYTKRRLEPQQLSELLTDPEAESRYIEVSDRFGDYGICGFYSLRDGRLTDFLFSCRVLNMGVEQWVYTALKHPLIEVSGEVAGALESVSSVDWINQEGLVRQSGKSERRVAPVTAKVFLKGACDLMAVNDFLGGSLDTEFNGVTTAGVPEHRGHTEILRRSTPDVVARYGSIIERLPFLDLSSYDSKLFKSSDYTSIVLSLLPDYIQGVYRLRGTDFRVPFGFHDDDITDLELLALHPERLEWLRLEPEFVEWFAENFEFMGPLEPDAFKENIRWLARSVPTGSQLVLINAPEVAVDFMLEEGRHLRYREMNQALEEVVRELPDVTILDVRQFIRSRDDLAGSVSRYRRRVYLHMAEAVRELVDGDVKVRQISKSSLRSSAKSMSRSAKAALPPKVLHALGELKQSLRGS